MPLNTKEWLRRARILDKLIDAKIADRDRALELACQCTSNISPDKVSASSENSHENRMIKYVEYTEEIDRMIDRLLQIKSEIKKAIDSVDDIVLQAVLTEYYINCKTWEQVAVDMNYSYMQVCRLHGKALQKIKML